MKRTKILFVAEELSINGAMKSLISLLKALPKDRYDLSLFLFKHGGELDDQIPKEVRLLAEMLPYAIYRLPLNKSLLAAIKHGRIDLAIFRIIIAVQRYLKSNYFGLWSFIPKIPGHYDLVCGYADGFVAPVVIKKTDSDRKVNWIHYLYSSRAQPKYVYRALQKLNFCIPVSIEAGKDLDIVLGFPTRKHIVHNITDVNECEKLASEPLEITKRGGVIRIVSVGRVTDQKKFHIIPRIAEILISRNIEFEWFIVGNGDQYNYLVNQVNEMNLNHYVHFIGPRTNPMPWIKSADIFINPSKNESWGMTVSEALCMGKAVIASNIKVFTEQITDGENGLLCPATPCDVADAVCRLIHDPNLRKKLERNAIQYPFTKQTIIHEFNQIITK